MRYPYTCLCLSRLPYILRHPSNQATPRCSPSLSDLAAECGIEGIDAIPSRSREEETPAALPEKEETSPEAEEEQEERKLQSERRQNTHMIRNVIIALIIADILFVLVVAFFLFVL